jgi:hypothetical protein
VIAVPIHAVLIIQQAAVHSEQNAFGVVLFVVLLSLILDIRFVAKQDIDHVVTIITNKIAANDLYNILLFLIKVKEFTKKQNRTSKSEVVSQRWVDTLVPT